MPDSFNPPQTEEYAISIGLYCFYFPYGTQENYLKGFKITDINKSPNVHTQKEVGHQLAADGWAEHVTLKSDAGDLTVKGMFEFESGTGEPPRPVRSRIKGPAGTVMLGLAAEADGKVDIFFECGANVQEEGAIEGAFGEVMETAVKFKLSGKPKMGTTACGRQVAASLAAEQINQQTGQQSGQQSAP